MSRGHTVPGTAVVWALIALGAVLPASAQTLKFERIGSIPGPADMVEVQGRYAYIAADKTLTVFDISAPADPKRLGSHSFPEQIWGFRVAGSTVYVAADFFGLGILDVSNPRSPVLRGSLKTPGQAKNVSVSGSRVLVADHMEGVDVIDATDPAKPVALNSFFLDGYARDVVTSGSLAFAVDAPAGFYVFDLSKPGAFEPVGSLQSATLPRAVEVTSTSGGAAPNVAVTVGGSTLQVYDIANPSALALAATLQRPGGAQRVALVRELAYVADGSHGLQVFDLSMPSKPVAAGSYATERPARDVAVGESLVLVVVGRLRSGWTPPDAGEVVILREAR